MGIAPVGGSHKNVVGVNGTSGPNLFADPNAARAAYDYSYAGQIGQRNGIRGDGFFTIDASLGKRFLMPWSDKQSLQFRWEVFNAFNNVNFTQRNIQRRYDRPAVLGQYRFTEAPRVMQFALRYEF